MNSNKRFVLLFSLTVIAIISMVSVAGLTSAALRVSQIFSLCILVERTGCGITPITALIALGSWITVLVVWIYALRITQRELLLDATLEVLVFLLPQVVIVSGSITLINGVSLLQAAFWKEPLIYLIVGLQVLLSFSLVKATQRKLLRRSENQS